MTPSLNIWCAKKTMKVAIGREEVTILAREFLFLLGQDKTFYTFQTEGGKKIKIAIKAEQEGKIERLF